MTRDTLGGIPEGYKISGLAHHPGQLRGNPGFMEGRDFVVIGGVGYILTRKQGQVVGILQQAA